jgi:hypothetical protein
MGSTTKDAIGLDQAVKLYAQSGINLYGGLTEMALVSSLTFGRLAYQYLEKLRNQAKLQAETASDVMDSLSKLRGALSSSVSVPAPAPPPSKEEDLREQTLLNDILGFIDVEKIGVLPSSELTSSSFEARWR